MGPMQLNFVTELSNQLNQLEFLKESFNES